MDCHHETIPRIASLAAVRRVHGVDGKRFASLLSAVLGSSHRFAAARSRSSGGVDEVCGGGELVSAAHRGRSQQRSSLEYRSRDLHVLRRIEPTALLIEVPDRVDQDG